jgi:hypothetical protein
MRFLFPFFLSILLGQRSSASFPGYISDADTLSTDLGASWDEESSLWDLSTDSEFAEVSTALDETELNLEPSSLLAFEAGSHSSSCYAEGSHQDGKARKRGLGFCPMYQGQKSPDEVELPAPEPPIVFDDLDNGPNLEYSFPGLDLKIDHPKCKHRKFVTHVCCDGPPEAWNFEGFFPSVKKCWPCA